MLQRVNAIQWLVVAGLWLGFAAPGQAARLLQFFVIVNGQTNLHTFYSSADTTPTESIWRNLKSPPIMVEEGQGSLTPDAGQPLQATLTGAVELRLCHVTRVLAQCTVTNLVLVRRDANKDYWHLPAAEAERTARAAGLGAAAAAGRANDAKLIIALLLVFVGLSVILVLIRRAKQDG